MTKNNYVKKLDKVKKEVADDREKNHYDAVDNPINKIDAGRSGLSGGMSFPDDHSQNNNYQNPFSPNSTIKSESKTKPNKSKSDKSNSGRPKLCPFSGAPCKKDDCELWVDAKNKKYAGCVLRISLPSASMDAKKTAWALIALCEENPEIKVPYKFKNKE